MNRSSNSDNKLDYLSIALVKMKSGDAPFTSVKSRGLDGLCTNLF